MADINVGIGIFEILTNRKRPVGSPQYSGKNNLEASS